LFFAIEPACAQLGRAQARAARRHGGAQGTLGYTRVLLLLGDSDSTRPPFAAPVLCARDTTPLPTQAAASLDYLFIALVDVFDLKSWLVLLGDAEARLAHAAYAGSIVQAQARARAYAHTHARTHACTLT
jgi:hypothetical protein